MNTQTDYNQQAINFLTSTGTKLTIKYKTYGKHFAGDDVSRSIFRCKLKNDRGYYSFDFGQSIANGNQDPTAYDVLTCLTKYDPFSFEDFCAEFGYDTDSRSAERTYKAVVKEWEAVDKLFTSEEIEAFQEIQ